MGKVSIPTHESFSLNRPALSQILSLAIERDHAGETRRLTSDDIHELTSLGTRQVKAARPYAKSSGLVNEQDKPTRFGGMAFFHDTGLSQVTTQWALHYHLTSTSSHTPSFWRHLVVQKLQPDTSFTTKQVADEIKRFHLTHEEKPLAGDTYERAATEFLGTYAKWDGLGALGFLKETGPGEYVVDEPAPAPWPVVAYALADTWAGRWADRVGVNLDETREVGALLLMGSGTLNARLRAMQERGMVEVQRRHPPYQVTRLSLDPVAVLEHLYEPDDGE